MSVICQNCQTENRDKAMFCRGCAGKLPAFAATGPSALATLGGSPRRKASRAPGAMSASRSAAFGAPTMGWRFAAALLLGVIVIALLAWIAMAPGRTADRTSSPAMAASAAPAPATATVTATAPTPASSPATTAVPTPMRPVALAAPAPVTPSVVPFESALSPGETRVEPQGAGGNAAPASPQLAPSSPPVRTATARTGAQRNAGEASGRADPRVGCEQMFFAFAARCEANHCAQAAYARHPRCAVVREQRLRDEARRNLTSGF